MPWILLQMLWKGSENFNYSNEIELQKEEKKKRKNKCVEEEDFK